MKAKIITEDKSNVGDAPLSWIQEGKYEYYYHSPRSFSFTQFLNDDEKSCKKRLLCLNYSYYKYGNLHGYTSGERCFFFTNNKELIKQIEEQSQSVNLKVEVNLFDQSNYPPHSVIWESCRVHDHKGKQGLWGNLNDEPYYYISVPFSSYPGTFHWYLMDFIKFISVLDKAAQLGPETVDKIFTTLKLDNYYFKALEALTLEDKEMALQHAKIRGNKILFRFGKHFSNELALPFYTAISPSYEKYPEAAHEITSIVMNYLQLHDEGKINLSQEKISEYETLKFKFGLWKLEKILLNPPLEVIEKAKNLDDSLLMFLLGQYYERSNCKEAGIRCFEIYRDQQFPSIDELRSHPYISSIAVEKKPRIYKVIHASLFKAVKKEEILGEANGLSFSPKN
jgi:hypothetical protein